MENEEFIDINVADNQYILSTHEILVDSTLKSLQTTDGIRSYAKRALKRVMGDEAEISTIKLKKPRIFARISAKFTGNTPQAHLYVTTKF